MHRIAGKVFVCVCVCVLVCVCVGVCVWRVAGQRKARNLRRSLAATSCEAINTRASLLVGGCGPPTNIDALASPGSKTNA